MSDLEDEGYSGKAVDGNYEALMDPDRARERQRLADMRSHGAAMQALDGLNSEEVCRAARARLLQPREVDADPNRACLRGDPLEKAGVLTREEYAQTLAVRRERERAAAQAERLRDPRTRREEEERLAAELAAKDKAAFARDAEERAKRLEAKRGKLAEARPAAGGGRKRARISFDEDADGSDAE
mmetsp:Transcript_91072/g.288445  ORF Transcript_91072/g.288445 Transcript_91072/m.288445 type:complete len:185 (-) Transcript_91072:81-635(-)